MADNKKPPIRFKGFTNPWEQCNIGDVIEDYFEKTVVQNQYPVLTSSQQLGIVLQEDYFADRQVTTNDNIGYYVLPKGYFTYRSRSDTDIFVFNRNNLIYKGIISYYYPVFKAKNSDANFLLRRLNHGIKHQLTMAAEGTGQKVLAHTKFKNMDVQIPSIDEQVKIGALFEHLDNLITLHQRKFDKLKNIKKSCIEKMFPKNGADVPEIRFKGFTDPWQQRKLGEIMNVTSVKRIHQSDWTNSGVRFLRARDIVSASKNEEPDDYLYISKEKYDEYSALSGKVQIGDLLVTGVGTIGIPLLIRDLEPLYFKDGNIIWFQNGEKIDGNFFYYSFWSEKVQYFINESAGIGTVGTYTIDSGKKTPMMLPSKREQEQIGDYFIDLDNLITLHQRELNKLQNIKKSCLEKMFI